MIQYSNLFTKTEKQEYVRLALDQHGSARQYILLETPEAKRYAGFTMMVRDIDLVIQAIGQLADSKLPVILQQSLFFFAVVTYAKSFASNESGRPKLESSDIFKDADTLLKEEHDHVMRLRNGYVAHAGAELDRCLVVGTVVDMGFAVGFDINCQLSQPFNMTPKLADFQKLCEFVKTIVSIKVDRSLNQVMEYATNLNEEAFEKVVKTPARDELYKLVASENSLKEGVQNFEFVKI